MINDFIEIYDSTYEYTSMNLYNRDFTLLDRLTIKDSITTGYFDDAIILRGVSATYSWKANLTKLYATATEISAISDSNVEIRTRSKGVFLYKMEVISLYISSKE